MKTMKMMITLFAVAGLVLALAPAAQASAYSTAVLADNPLAYYQFNETIGTVATDSANSYNGTYENGVSLNQSSLATLGTSVLFDSLGNYVAVPDMGTLTEITIEVWLKPTSNQDLKGIYSTPWGAGVTIFLRSTGDLQNSFHGTIPRDPLYDTNLPVNSWTHTVWTLKKSEGWAPSLYTNGTLFATTSSRTANDTNAATTPTAGKIGADASFGTREYEGYMDEFAIYGSVLTPTQVQAHYDAATAATPYGTVLIIR
jgi:hypothetical protein